MAIPASSPVDAGAHARGDDQALLDITELGVRYGGVQAVRSVSLRVDEPQVIGLIGPNGAGKSSLLAAIGGQARVANGTVVLNGRDITKLSPHARARLGIVRTFQTAGVFERLTVFENLMVAAVGYRGASLTRALLGGARVHAEAEEARGRALRLLADLEIFKMRDSYCSDLSGGQRRLVEIGRSLMCSPRLLLLDEPTVGVAPQLVRHICETIVRIRSAGVAVIIVEHALELIEEFCDRVIVLAAGEVLGDGNYEDIMKSGAVRDAYLA